MLTDILWALSVPTHGVSLSARNPRAGCCQNGHSPDEGGQARTLSPAQGQVVSKRQAWDLNPGTDSRA